MKLLKLGCLFGLLQLAFAHPISLLWAHVRVQPDGLEIRLKIAAAHLISVCEVDAEGGPIPRSVVEQQLPDHQSFVLENFHVRSGPGAPLPGTIVAADLSGIPAEGFPLLKQYETFFHYTVRYPLDRPPEELSFHHELSGHEFESVVEIVVEGAAGKAFPLLQGETHVVRFSDSGASAVSSGGIALGYARMGLEHILQGWDHLLFILALAFSVKRLMDLVKVVSLFTVAHSVTLTLSVLDIVRLPGWVVEPMIAASIVYAAVEGFWNRAHGWSWSRLGVVFGFGLFHGLGFAGGLVTGGIGGGDLAVAIAAFSLGVEAGHQLIVIPAFIGLWVARKRCGDLALRRLSWSASCLIGAAGIYYLTRAVLF